MLGASAGPYCGSQWINGGAQASPSIKIWYICPNFGLRDTHLPLAPNLIPCGHIKVVFIPPRDIRVVGDALDLQGRCEARIVY